MTVAGFLSRSRGKDVQKKLAAAVAPRGWDSSRPDVAAIFLWDPS